MGHYVWNTIVRLSDIDLFQVAYYFKTLEWCNSAREHWMIEYILNEHNSYLINVVELTHKFHTPARYGDKINVELTFDNIKRTNFWANLDVFKIGDDGEKTLIGTHRQRIVYLTLQGRPTLIPDLMLEKMSRFIAHDQTLPGVVTPIRKIAA